MAETSKKPHYTSPEEVAKMRSMRWEGHSTADIMKATGRSDSVVRRWAPVSREKRLLKNISYTAEQKRVLIKEMKRMFYDDGKTYREISAATGVSRKTISEWLQVKGNTQVNVRQVKASIERLTREGLKPAQVAKELGIHRNTVYKYMPPTEHWWTHKELQVALEMEAKGCSNQMIANRLGRTRQAVGGKLRHYKKGLAQ